VTVDPGVEGALEALPDLVRDTPPGDRRRAGEVSDQLRAVLVLLPPGLLDELVAQVRAADAAWRGHPRPAAADRLAGLVEDLAVKVDALTATGGEGVLPSDAVH
jgi:hypothetical protein